MAYELKEKGFEMYGIKLGSEYQTPSGIRKVIGFDTSDSSVAVTIKKVWKDNKPISESLFCKIVLDGFEKSAFQWISATFLKSIAGNYNLYENRLYAGMLVQHFKGGIYEIISMDVTHTETLERMVVYKCVISNKVYTRPYGMFMSKVDKDKYPEAKQEYRLERYIK